MSKLNIALVGAGRRGGGAHLPVIAKLNGISRFGLAESWLKTALTACK